MQKWFIDSAQFPFKCDYQKLVNEYPRLETELGIVDSLDDIYYPAYINFESLEDALVKIYEITNKRIVIDFEEKVITIYDDYID